MGAISKLKGTRFEFSIFLIVVAVEILWRLNGSLELIKFFGDSYEFIFPWSLRAIFFVIVGWFCMKKNPQKPFAVATIGLYRGAALGILIGLFELIWYHNINAFIFLLALPWQTMFVGFIVSGVTAYIMSIWKEEKREYLKN